MIVFGGKSEDGISSNLWSIDLVSKSATKLLSSGSFQPSRYGHASIVVEDYLYVYGGFNAASTQAIDFWRFDLVHLIWTELGIGLFPARSFSGIVYLPACDTIFIVMGLEGTITKKSILAFNRVNSEVHIVEVSTGKELTFAKQGAIAVSSGSRIYLFGGLNFDSNGVQDSTRGGANELLEWV